MRGRDWFHVFSPLVRLVVVVFRLMPNACVSMLWALLDASHGRLGLGLRYCIVKAKAGGCGDCVYIGPNVELRHWRRLHLGSNVSIHRFSYLDAMGEIHIGDHVSVSHNCSLVSFDHTWTDPSMPIRDNPVVTSAIVLEDDVWLGCGVRVVSGVRIASRCAIAAGAVVTRDTQSGYLYAGVPAKPIKVISGEAPCREA